jgi:hypothetical protein
MKAHVQLLVMALAVLVGAACRRHHPRVEGDLNDQLDELADRACACTTSDCAESVVEELVQMSKNAGVEGDAKRANASGRRIGECAIKAGMDPQKFLRAVSTMGNSQ